MTEGVPGGDPEIAGDSSVGNGIEGVVMRWFVALVRVGAYLAIPPLALHGDPIQGIWRWRKIYLVFAVGTGLVFLPSVLSGDLGLLLLFPIFHLILAALLAELLIAMVAPDVSASIPTLSIGVPMPVLAGTLAALAVIAVMLRSFSVPLPAISWPFGGNEEPKYDIEMTEVWKSGGKHE